MDMEFSSIETEKDMKANGFREKNMEKVIQLNLMDRNQAQIGCTEKFRMEQN